MYTPKMNNEINAQTKERPRHAKIKPTPQSRIIINNRDSSIIQTDRMCMPSSHPGVMIQPAQNLLMPHEEVLGILYPNHNNNTVLARRALLHTMYNPPAVGKVNSPMRLIRKVQETARNPPFLEDVEQTQTL